MTTALSLLGSSALGVAPASASCTTTTSTGHCYGYAQWDVPAGVHGAKAQLRTNCMLLTNPATQFLTQELWVYQGSYWVETGLTNGYADPSAGVPGNYVTTPHFYWADGRPGTGGYHEHYDLVHSASLNTYYQAEIAYVSSGTWSVAVGPFSSTSVNNFTGNATQLTAGFESSERGAQTFGSAQSLQYKNLSDTYVSGWNGAGNPATAFGSGATASWVTYPTWVQDGFGATC